MATSQTGQRRLQWLAGVTAAAAYLLIVIGGAVRISGAGLSCGTDWPLCNGRLLPGADLLALVEVLHRLGALIVIVLTAGLTYTAWQNRARDRWYSRLGLLALSLVLVQAGLGALTVRTRLSAPVVALHLGVSLVYLATTLILATRALTEQRHPVPAKPVLGWLGWITSGMLFVLLVSGTYTAVRGGGFACPDWPICGQSWLPEGWSAVDIQLIHRWLALATLLLLVLTTWRAWRREVSPLVTGLTIAALALFIAQVFVGAATVWFQLNPAVRAAHLAVSAFLWALLILALTADQLGLAPVPVRRQFRVQRAMQVLRDYWVLMKPGVMVLLLLTTFCAMLVAERGWPAWHTLLWTLLGGVLSSGGAAAINHFWDRDADALMTRTRTRPLPQGRLRPEHAAIFGVTLSVLAVYLLTAFVNPVAALLALAGNLFYVFVYTIWLKRTTPQNIVIGGAAGAVPPLVGWAAITHTISLPALLMFLVVFAWTPPHFWALALYKRTDYAVAGIPMMPAVRGEEETRRQIFLYTVLLVLASLAFYPTGALGLFYLIAALVLGARFIWLTAQLLRERDDRIARKVFFYSMQYLGLLFLAMVIDVLIRSHWG